MINGGWASWDNKIKSNYTCHFWSTCNVDGSSDSCASGDSAQKAFLLWELACHGHGLLGGHSHHLVHCCATHSHNGTECCDRSDCAKFMSWWTTHPKLHHWESWVNNLQWKDLVHKSADFVSSIIRKADKSKVLWMYSTTIPIFTLVLNQMYGATICLLVS